VVDDDPLGAATRLLVYGVCGSGKTTMAERISQATALPWHSVDDLMWEPGWIEVPEDEQRRRIGEICTGDRWILDTAYGRWLDVPLSHADLIVALDYPRWVSLQRLVRRTAGRCWDKRTICNGNTETLKSAFSRNSIIRWHFRSFKRKQRRIGRWMAGDGGPQVVRLTSPRQAEAWLHRLAAARSPIPRPGHHSGG